MRKLISIVLVLSLMTMLTDVATAIEAGEDVAPALYTSSGEEKVYCNATVEDDFAENRVMIVLSNEASLKFSAYEAENFSEIACDCGDVIYEPHIWNGARTICLVCGFRNDDLGVLYFQKPNDE